MTAVKVRGHQSLWASSSGSLWNQCRLYEILLLCCCWSRSTSLVRLQLKCRACLNMHAASLNQSHTKQWVGDVWLMWDTGPLAADKLYALSVLLLSLSVTMASLLVRPAATLPDSLYFSLCLRKLPASVGPLTWAGSVSVLSGRLAALMKLLNEAERGHLCSGPDDHACHWHGQRRWHLGANYTDFTPARVWIKPVLSDGWVQRFITPKPGHLWSPGDGNDWQAKWRGSWRGGKKKVVGKRAAAPLSFITLSWNTRIMAHATLALRSQWYKSIVS